MKRMFYAVPLLILLIHPVSGQEKKGSYPTAILDFADRSTAQGEKGELVAGILFATLAAEDQLVLVERREIKKILDELKLNASGVIKTSSAAQVGQLTGAKILITGSIFKAGDKTYLIGKIIGTETSRVVGASESGKEDVSVLAERLGRKLAAAVKKSAAKLMPQVLDHQARLKLIRETIGRRKLPAAFIKITEKHIGQPAIDPSAETELGLFYKELGGELQAKAGGNAYTITGQGVSEFAGEIHGMKSVKARLEVKVVDSNGKVVAVDRQTGVHLDLTEALAGKQALQEAAAKIASRLLPKLAK